MISKKRHKNCSFCHSVDTRQRRIVANRFVWSFLSHMPIVPGHTLIVPVRCVATFSELTAKEKTALFKLLDTVTGALRKTFGAEGFNFAWNEGDIAGQSVPHFHLHVVPRKKGDTGLTNYEPRKFLYRPGSREVSPKVELLQVCNLIKKNLYK